MRKIIKDSELTYIFDEGNNKNEKEETLNMIKSSLLNLSLCNFYLKIWNSIICFICCIVY